MLTPILMAGGSGTRLWPLSRKASPKQVQPLLDDETMLQKTARRLSRGFGIGKVWVTTNPDYLARVKEEVRGVAPGHLSIEPHRRGTAPALGLALVRILKEDPEAVVVHVNSDNHVGDEREFTRVLKVAESLVRVEPDRLVMIGVRPTYPETGYGYIRMGDLVARVKRGKGKGEDEVFSVRAFVEKPDSKTAKRYVENWEYLWNPTLIVARADALLARYAKHLPEMHLRLMRIGASLGTAKEKQVVDREFKAMIPTALEYSILEKEKGMAVIPAAFGWTDVGSWRAVHDILSGASGKTVAKGLHVEVDSSDNLIVGTAGRLIATVGLHGMVVVDTPDAVLVCPKDRAQEVKRLVEGMAKRKFGKYV